MPLCCAAPSRDWRKAATSITDWTDTKMGPEAAGHFNVDDDIDYIVEYLGFGGPDAVGRPLSGNGQVKPNDRVQGAKRTLLVLANHRYWRRLQDSVRQAG